MAAAMMFLIRISSRCQLACTAIVFVVFLQTAVVNTGQYVEDHSTSPFYLDDPAAGVAASDDSAAAAVDNNDETTSMPREFCHHARFEARCSRPGHVLVFQRAVYGRMKVGGCVKTNFGYVGCYVDVLDVLNRRCTGRPDCGFDVVEPTFHNRRPCNVELKNYLEVEFSCVRALTPQPLTCQAALTDRRAVFYVPGSRSSIAADRLPTSAPMAVASSNCGSSDAIPLTVDVSRPGQRINVSVIDLAQSPSFATSSFSSSGGTICRRYARFTEPSLLPVADAASVSRDLGCAGTDVDGGGSAGSWPRKRPHVGESMTYASQTGSVQLVLDRSSAHDDFLLIFTAVGCGDLDPTPARSWVRYSSDRRTAEIGCGTAESGRNPVDAGPRWTLECHSDTWTGHLGNCSNWADDLILASSSSRPDSYRLNAVTVALIWLCVAVAISLCVLVLGLVIYRRTERRCRCRSSPSGRPSTSSGSAAIHPQPSATTTETDSTSNTPSRSTVPSTPAAREEATASNTIRFYQRALLERGLYASVRIRSSREATSDCGRPATTEIISVLPGNPVQHGHRRRCSFCERAAGGTGLIEATLPLAASSASSLPPRCRCSCCEAEASTAAACDLVGDCRTSTRFPDDDELSGRTSRPLSANTTPTRLPHQHQTVIAPIRIMSNDSKFRTTMPSGQQQQQQQQLRCCHPKSMLVVARPSGGTVTSAAVDPAAGGEFCPECRTVGLVQYVGDDR